MFDPLIIREHVYFTLNSMGFMDNLIMNKKSSFDKKFNWNFFDQYKFM
jgi:hypothetical protein